MPGSGDIKAQPMHVDAGSDRGSDRGSNPRASIKKGKGSASSRALPFGVDMALNGQGEPAQSSNKQSMWEIAEVETYRIGVFYCYGINLC